MLLHMGILPGTATEKLAAGMLLLGILGVSGSRGMLVEAPEVVVCRGWLGCLSLAPQALLSRAIPW